MGDDGEPDGAEEPEEDRTTVAEADCSAGVALTLESFPTAGGFTLPDLSVVSEAVPVTEDSRAIAAAAVVVLAGTLGIDGATVVFAVVAVGFDDVTAVVIATPDGLFDVLTVTGGVSAVLVCRLLRCSDWGAAESVETGPTVSLSFGLLLLVRVGLIGLRLMMCASSGRCLINVSCFFFSVSKRESTLESATSLAVCP